MTGILNKTPELKKVGFHLTRRGFRMFFTYPERYPDLLEKPQLIEELLDLVIVFQLSAISLSVYYYNAVQKLAEKLIDIRPLKW